MKTKKFKADINCSDCVRNVMPYLNSLSSVREWHIDTEGQEKILTVEGEFEDEEIERAAKDAGFEVMP